MLKEIVRAKVQSALEAGNTAQGWNLTESLVFEVTQPKQPEHGDFSTNIALVLAAHLRKQALPCTPRALATTLIQAMPPGGPVAAWEVAGPGFINVRIDPAWYQEQCAHIVCHPDATGRQDWGQGQQYQVEFVSANPTGPLHFGGARNAVLGDVLARVHEAAGFCVQREFYVNDAGVQFDLFVASLWAAFRQSRGHAVSYPEGGYTGAYMQAYAQRLADRTESDLETLSRAEALQAIRPLALAIVLEDVRDEIALLDITFDEWFREQALHDDGLITAGIEHLSALGFTYEKDGALWFAASRFAGNDQDVVLVRRTGEPTYFAADIAYHRNKLETRNFSRIINVWAVDHQGHIPRMKAMVAALGHDPDRLKIVVYDLVKLVREGREVTMSKRAGQFLTLREVVAEVGKDAVRFMLLTRAPESVIEFDLTQVKTQHQDNPVYFVQYSHARLCSIQAHAQAQGITMPTVEVGVRDLMQQLNHDAELALMKTLLDLDREIEIALHRYSPHNLTYYAMRIASSINAFYRDCRVLDPDQLARSQARLLLCTAARIVLARVLELLGVHAPETM